ncbi:hypothetical protein KCU83_g85, partial [Aureobasidium melanogenum]
MSRYVLSLLASATSHVGGVRYACGIPPFDAKVSVLPSAAVVSSMYLTGLNASLRGVRSDKGFSGLREKNLAGEAAEMLGRLAGCGLALVGEVGVKVLADGLGLNSIALTLSLAEAVEGLELCTAELVWLERHATCQVHEEGWPGSVSSSEPCAVFGSMESQALEATSGLAGAMRAGLASADVTFDSFSRACSSAFVTIIFCFSFVLARMGTRSSGTRE